MPAVAAKLITLVQDFPASSSRSCVQPEWSDFVKGATGDSGPAAALPWQLGQVRSIQIANDIASLAKRIAKTIVAKFPGMEIHALPDPLAGNSDALLKFNAACRRKEAGAPDGFYVTEAVLYKSSVVLFYWTDNGDPAWRHLPRECFGQAMISPVCQSRFRTADIAFTEVFTSSLAKAHGAP